MAPDPGRIGMAIRRARERKRMRQQDLADAIGVSRNAVDAWENGRAYPRRSMGAIEEVLGINLTDDPAPAASGLVAEDEWERLVLADETLPYSERADIVRRSRKIRERLYPALEPRPAPAAHHPQAPEAAAG